jgi:hypothetical protein
MKYCCTNGLSWSGKRRADVLFTSAALRVSPASDERLQEGTPLACQELIDPMTPTGPGSSWAGSVSRDWRFPEIGSQVHRREYARRQMLVTELLPPCLLADLHLSGLPESFGMQRMKKNAPTEAVGRRMDAGQDAKTEIFAYLLSQEELCPSRKFHVASSSGAP